MPKSRVRRKREYIPPPTRSAAKMPSPRWLAPLMVGLFLVGLAWILAYYLSQARFPIPGIEHWNLAIGFALILGGFGLSTRWK